MFSAHVLSKLKRILSIYLRVAPKNVDSVRYVIVNFVTKISSRQDYIM